LGNFTNLRAFKIDIIEQDSEKFGIPYKKIITKQDLEQHEDKLKQAQAVIINTCYGKIIQIVSDGKGKIDKDFPYLSKDAAEFLSLFDLKLIGIDSLTVDAYKENIIHQLLFKKNPDLIILETLVNLENAPEEFTLNCAPLKIKDSDGSPVRAYAVVD